MASAGLLLSPAGPVSGRVLVRGPCLARRHLRPGNYRFTVKAGELASFSTLESIIADLKRGETRTSVLRTLAAAGEDVARLRAAERALHSQSSLHAAALASKGTLASLRRVTRESAETSIVIDRAARAIICSISGRDIHRVIVPQMEQIDRPSLKTIARACLLAGAPNSPEWEWQLGATLTRKAPPEDFELAARSLFSEVRADLLRSIIGILDLQSSGAEPTAAIERSAPSGVDIGTVCAWLAVQNFDACFFWAGEERGSDHASAVDTLRLLAMTATHTGRHDLALTALNRAYDVVSKPSLRAHLAYMQGLLFAKRKLDLAASRAWYEQGLLELGSAQAGDDGDMALEEAWIYNGLALNALLEPRLSGRPIASAFDATFDLLRRAFALVEQGRSPDRVYLRHNLLSNMSSFLELQGEYKLALHVLESAFGPELTAGLPDAQVWQAMLATRRAGLHAKAGDPITAEHLYRDAIECLIDVDRLILAEIVRRSLGSLVLSCGRTTDAEGVFRSGLREALAARTREGARIHGAGLVTSLIIQGRRAAAADLVRELGETESLWLCDREADLSQAFSSAASTPQHYALSTSIPEVDLEEFSNVSVAGILQQGRGAAQRPVPLNA